MHIRCVSIALTLSAVTLLIPPVGALAQGAYTDLKQRPDLPGVEHIDAALEAYNSNDAEQIGAFLERTFTPEFYQSHTPEEHASVWEATYARVGPLEYEAVRTYEPERNDLVVVLWAPVIESWRAMVMMPGEDGLFQGMYFAPVRTPSYVEPGDPLSPEEAAAKLNQHIDRLVQHDMFSGTVKITKGGRVILERSAGLASRRFDVPNRQDTKFNLGSMNKMFTAVSIGQLVEAGKLTFDDTVGAHLPDYPNEEIRDRVKIKHLLSHTGGTGNHFTDGFVEGSKMRFRETSDYVDLFADQDLQFSPGEEWSYSNAGFFILGLIIEAASGESYYDYVRNHIFEPAGMTDTDSFDMDIPIKNLAIGYTRSPMGGRPDDGARWLEQSGGWRNNTLMHSIKGTPAGGGFSTTPDLIEFAGALQSGTLVSSPMFGTLTSAKPELSSPEYGFGFGVQRQPNVGRIVGHGGGFPGINGKLDIYLDQDISVAVLSNVDGGASLVAQRFQEMLMLGR